MKPVHLEGMGVVGCMLAWHLHQRAIPFTWSDAGGSPHVAWTASTGGVYPSGDKLSEWCRGEWLAWAAGAAPWSLFYPTLVETAHFWFASKSHPHGGRMPLGQRLGPLACSSEYSVHLNVQSFVRTTRNHFDGLERATPPRKAVQVVAAGGVHADYYLWGWSARVRLSYTHGLSPDGIRPTLYLRSGRYLLSYAYPSPGTPWHYAGSAMIRQSTPKSLAVAPKLQAWAEHVRTATDGLVAVATFGETTEGWRPCTTNPDLDRIWRPHDRGLFVQPLAHSGVRLAPEVVRQFFVALEAL